MRRRSRTPEHGRQPAQHCALTAKAQPGRTDGRWDFRRSRRRAALRWIGAPSCFRGAMRHARGNRHTRRCGPPYACAGRLGGTAAAPGVSSAPRSRTPRRPPVVAHSRPARKYDHPVSFGTSRRRSARVVRTARWTASVRVVSCTGPRSLSDPSGSFSASLSSANA